jgi:starch synthase
MGQRGKDRRQKAKDNMASDLKVLFLASEAVPFAKTGGLADVAGALPIALRNLGVDVRLVLPLYRKVMETGTQTRLVLERQEAALGDMVLKADILETEMDAGVPVYFVQREDLYDRPNLYGNAEGDYYDNLERFTFFARQALVLTESLPFKPDLIHCHDWQTGLVPALIKGPYRSSSVLGGRPTLFTIHNIGYQGLFPAEKLALTGLPKEGFFHPEGLEYWGKISLLKSGIVYSEAITTVSPTYAKEIQTSDFGSGMEGILRRRSGVLHGVLNGVNYQQWDPSKDAHLPSTYSKTRMGGKRDCKESLINEIGLDASIKDRPLLGIVSRLDSQKGMDLLLDVMDDMMKMDLGLVALGSGNELIQEKLMAAGKRYAGRMALALGFDEPLAHRIMAGADLFLVPSRYEPCGLTQMYALKYGTVPVVRATGGLEDTIEAFDPGTGCGNGFKFGPYEPKALLAAIRRAVATWEDKGARRTIIANGMKADFSWKKSAKAYLDLYQSIVDR